MHFRLHANYFLLPLKIPEEIIRQSMLFDNKRQYLACQTNVDTTFYHGSRLTWNCMFNGSIYYVLYLHILHFYLVGHSWVASQPVKSLSTLIDLHTFTFVIHSLLYSFSLKKLSLQNLTRFLLFHQIFLLSW